MLDLTVREKTFDGRPVLAPLHLRVAAGERVALMGPSGVGKTTLLSIAAGLDRRFKGIRHVGDGRLGMVFQEPRLLPWRSVLDNLLLCDPPGGETACRGLLRDVGLGEWVEAWPEQLSLGMQRRVAVARAFCVRPALVFMDEPFASLDADTAGGLRDLAGRLLRDSGAALLMVTHDPADAERLADRIIRLAGCPAALVDADAPAPAPAADPVVRPILPAVASS